VKSQETDEQLFQLCKDAPEHIVQEWRKRNINPRDHDAVMRFYIETQLYCYELIGMEIEAPIERQKQLRQFADFLIQNGKVVGCDYGSGIGTLGIFLNRSRIQCDFADVSDINLSFIRERLRQRNLPPVRLINLLREKLPENQYDFITAFDVLEHAADPLKVIEDISSKLKVDGLFIFNLLYDNEENTPHVLLDPNPIRKKLRSFGLKKVGNIGEFKIYRKVARSRFTNQLLLILDSAFWNAREALQKLKS
jgi:2-polyprenyl-3-methyl-5-hydroxy-6-metoxy-1,4-benzoquinol methylase